MIEPKNFLSLKLINKHNLKNWKENFNVIIPRNLLLFYFGLLPADHPPHPALSSPSRSVWEQYRSHFNRNDFVI